ncbi:ComEC/Rec2 family competence protein [Streptomyces wedmorensis]|uniref:ComEC/Rec2 family competence protein n=1 Tax=Streptomyces wedmorensis TaxID=43759 RepID=UPI00378BC10E
MPPPAEGPLGVSILDVGHGNSAVVHDGRLCAVVDAAPGNTVLSELERLNCERIEHLIISHSDKDHAGGGPTLLLDDSRTIGTVWFNPDSVKQTEIWPRLLRAVHTRVRRGGLDGHQMIHTETGQVLKCGKARLEIHHPSILTSGIGPGGTTLEGDRLDANSLSVVVRVHLAEQPAVLLAADIDGAALRRIQEDGHDLAAPVLVFPHHGGLPGKSAPQAFAQELTELVGPELVVFSIRGGQRPSNPNPAIMSGVREGAPDAHIACTQLSVHCHASDALVPEHHLALRPASGRKSGRCCAGTITVAHTPDGLVFDPPLANHRGFVASFVTQPLCRSSSTVPGPRQATSPSSESNPSR